MNDRYFVILVLSVRALYLMLQVLNHGFNLNLIEGMECLPRFSEMEEWRKFRKAEFRDKGRRLPDDEKENLAVYSKADLIAAGAECKGRSDNT